MLDTRWTPQKQYSHANIDSIQCAETPSRTPRASPNKRPLLATRSPSKANTLLKFMEITDNSSYANDFDLDDNQDLRLPVSSFSHLPGVSIVKSHDDAIPPTRRRGNSDSSHQNHPFRSDSSHQNHPFRSDSSHQNYPFRSGSSSRSNSRSNDREYYNESPFVSKIKSRISNFEVERDITSFPHRRSKSENNVTITDSVHHSSAPINSAPVSKNTIPRNRNIYPIGETSFNDENQSPFIDSSKYVPKIVEPKRNTNSQEVKNHKLRRSLPPHASNDISGSSSNHENAFTNLGSPVKSSFLNQSRPPFMNIENTPKRKSNHSRHPSVNVSLTPAQRVEKHPGTKSNNALEHFQFSNLVGRGAFANVYKGINLKTNQVVAIKQIALEKDQDFMELMGEIDLLKILKHPNIVKYHGFVKTSSSLNVFLEYCSGGSLRQLYRKRGHGMPEAEIKQYVESILHGLNYLHEQGVVHRDVKAANVLLTAEGDVKLADFGVATKVSSQHYTIVGTPNWMAPETVLGGEGLCTSSDIWSLGATIIELFTTKPPYHDLNPMATLHAIGTDDHPPLPKGLSPLAKEFLLECFQKQPSLRISAKLLVKHKWLQQSKSSSPSNKARKSSVSEEIKTDVKPIQNYSESNEENWEGDFADLKSNQLQQPNIIVSPEMGPSRNLQNWENETVSKLSKVEPKRYTKKEILNKFTDKTEDDFEFEHESSRLILVENSGLNDDANNHDEDNDPFSQLDIENFDTNEIEIQSKMEFLISKFSTRLDICRAGNDEVALSIIKITGRMLHLVKKYPISHDVLIRDHGILSLFELLEKASELPKHQKLWYHTLSILNIIFESNTAQFENFCLLGGIPVATQFRNASYDNQVRLQVVRFIKLFKKSDRALSMFVSSGGLRVLSKFAEEDFDYTPEFPLVAIDTIHDILSKDLTRYKSDLCRILSKYGVIFWFVVLLDRLTKFDKTKDIKLSQEQVGRYIDMIIEIIRYFSNSEARVRVNISNVDLYKLLIKVYSKLQYSAQLSIMKFFRSMSCVPALLDLLYDADILEFLVRTFQEYEPSNKHYKEIANTVCPLLFNCCYLNHAREKDLVELGAVPLLKRLSKIKLEFRQFVLPILCELVYCESSVRYQLEKHDILSVYFNLVVDPYWQANALDSILHWAQQDPQVVKLDSPIALNCLISGFMLPQVSNLESTLENYLKLLNHNRALRKNMNKELIIRNVLGKLNAHNSKPVVQLTLLRILKLFVLSGRSLSHFKSSSVLGAIKTVLPTLKSRESSVLVEELIGEIMTII